MVIHVLLNGLGREVRNDQMRQKGTEVGHQLLEGRQSFSHPIHDWSQISRPRQSRSKPERNPSVSRLMVEVFAAARFRVMELITILNRCHRFRGFVYQHARFTPDQKSIEVAVQPRRGSAAPRFGRDLFPLPSAGGRL
jgi:hypothetical protein